jgi:hypothetical protein
VIHWLASLPAAVLFPAFAIIGVCLTIAFDVLMRRWVQPETRSRASPTASVTLQVAATIYAILIAFVIVDAYNQVQQTQREVSSKASSLAIVFENSRSFEAQSGVEVRAAALRYAKAVLHRGIPRLQDSGKPDEHTDDELEVLFRVVQAVEPKNQSDQAAYDATVRALDGIVATRAELLDSARATVPDTLLALLFVIGLIVMGLATLLDTQHRGSHLVILSALALVIWLTLALVVSLDFAFDGVIRVSDQPLRDFVEFRAAR